MEQAELRLNFGFFPAFFLISTAALLPVGAIFIGMAAQRGSRYTMPPFAAPAVTRII